MPLKVGVSRVCLFVWGFVYARDQGPFNFTRYVQTRVLPGYTRPLEGPGTTGAGLTGVGDPLQYAKARGGVLTTGRTLAVRPA